MIRLNLKIGRTVVNLRPVRLVVVGLLLLGIVAQSYLYFQKSVEQERKQNEIEGLKNQMHTLQEQKQELKKTPENFEALNGALTARNDWLKRREKSPVYLLAKLEQERPAGGVELRTFESEGPRGTIKMAAGDLDTASRFMNAIFGNNVRVTHDERISTGIVAVCTWTD
ncbi:MAG: hypothetical protein HQM09_24200 [Candidatus Riflebacteria bacterium]|nr:hypothetical protein [Candidatus Riflebacteria bacterium]